MATDYDAPRKTEEEQSEDSIEELKARRHEKNSGKVNVSNRLAMNSCADIGLPSALKNVVADMCWMDRALPSRSFMQRHV